MRTFVVTGPEPALLLDEVKQHLRVDGTDEDELIRGYMAAAQASIDGPDGWLGRAIGEQVIEARFDNFDCGSLRLPYPPHISIVSVSYVGGDGAETEIDPAAYELLGASLQPVFGGAWPTPRWQREAVRVRYRAGYPMVGEGEEARPAIPPAIRAALLLMVDNLYNDRGGKTGLTPNVEALLSPLRVFA